ncbi:hypothetical protein GIB67_034138 [Kingdonia uniflora]|uniref:NAC domain-containing protein n=1 Tax=Kingdonia uniflora TaxID=39325 RepID=A0A7J7MNX5_9MAGN|nr:hypothetical protein GIB67_034138 [Kingdonia uniflora]
MSWAWLIGGREIAAIIKNATQLPSYQLKDHGAIRECPNCHHLIDNSDVSFEWPGLPAGVKFDPSDAELLEHLSGKIGLGNSEPHLFIEDFIPTLEGEDGICYKHPENLPGSKRKGNNVFFFHKTTSAYATGSRKRRKVLRQHNSSEDLRWHKTGCAVWLSGNGKYSGTWLIDSKTIAAKVKNATQPPSNQVKDCGANRQCPNCFHRIDNSDIVYQKGTEDDMSYRVFLNWRLLKASFVVPCLVQVAVEWPGLPAGVKFDPSDVELIKHLSGKAGLGNSEPHLFINEFIPTLEGEDGICYTHPENLPGSKRDGNSVHFFHRTSRAYATGPRKRRRIHGQCNSSEEHVRWHKTGKTKAMMENGIQRGWKKIMVLYKSSKKGYKPDKSNWVMHQYHLGAKEDEEEGEFVVSKIFFQQQAKQFGKDDIDHLVIEEPVTTGVRASPSTPLQHTANHSRQGKRVLLDEVDEENVYYSPAQDTELTLEAPESNQEDVSLEDLRGLPLWWEGKAQAVEESYNNLDSNARADDMDASLLCNENLDPYAPIDESGLQHVPYFFDFDESRSGMPGGDINTTYGISDLNNLEMGAPPFSLLDLQFGSQESLGWLDRL